MLDGWPPIKTKRFAGESSDEYARRAATVIEIVNSFRMGRYDRSLAEVMERKLDELLAPALEYRL